MTRTEISFIVPVYKTDPDTLNRCLKSIEASIEDETYQIIVIHDGLDIDDRITAIVQNFKEAELHRVRHGGVSAARNAGLNFAQADWVIFVDADDCLVPRSVTEMYSLISLNEEIDFLAANHFRKYEHKLVPIYNYNNKIDLFKKICFCRTYYALLPMVARYGALYLKQACFRKWNITLIQLLVMERI